MSSQHLFHKRGKQCAVLKWWGMLDTNPPMSMSIILPGMTVKKSAWGQVCKTLCLLYSSILSWWVTCIFNNSSNLFLVYCKAMMILYAGIKTRQACVPVHFWSSWVLLGRLCLFCGQKLTFGSTLFLYSTQSERFSLIYMKALSVWLNVSHASASCLVPRLYVALEVNVQEFQLWMDKQETL